MDDDNHHYDLPPLSSATLSAATILLSHPPPPPPPQDSHLPPILSQHCLGFSSPAPKSYFFTNPPPPPPPPPPPHDQLPSHFPPSSAFLSYSFNDLTTSLFQKDEGRRVLDAWSTKVARSKRRLARQRTLTLSRTSSSSSSTSAASSSGFGYNNDEYSKGLMATHFLNTDTHNNANPNNFTLCTPDNKILRMLLKKDLKNSDVGSLGRIVLPKREAEENLPLLTDKEGIQIVMREVHSNKKWAMKYKYWANNRSRMYVLENTGDFVRQNGLKMGDLMTLYEDECKNMYVAVVKGENDSREENEEMARNHNNKNNNNDNQPCSFTNMCIKDEEEDASLAMLIEELKHKPEDEDRPLSCSTSTSSSNSSSNNNNNNNALMASDSYLSTTQQQPSSSNMMGAAAKGIYNSNNNKKKKNGSKEGGEDLQAVNGLEDCFRGLDTLPEVSGFKFPLFDYLSNDRT
ncbi:B3 domain-containing transcription factor LEC2 [Cucurbita pepo subsp. pepo]|uniref:B3 domain-containing transcription factor LEC2 n=1 Tax=Cucurbita pepo subsp. pepo TaxID=3664 RepID=UPI000C9D996B|nr:B3 domain-containing transcription factor LEC2 [Cucurbita pepo subsp. pepo]